MRTAQTPLAVAIAALAASSTGLSLLTSAPAHAAADVTRTNVNGTYATDGSGDRNAAPIPVRLLFPVAIVDAAARDRGTVARMARSYGGGR